MARNASVSLMRSIHRYEVCPCVDLVFLLRSASEANSASRCGISGSEIIGRRVFHREGCSTGEKDMDGPRVAVSDKDAVASDAKGAHAKQSRMWHCKHLQRSPIDGQHLHTALFAHEQPFTRYGHVTWQFKLARFAPMAADGAEKARWRLSQVVDLWRRHACERRQRTRGAKCKRGRVAPETSRVGVIQGSVFKTRPGSHVDAMVEAVCDEEAASAAPADVSTEALGKAQLTGSVSVSSKSSDADEGLGRELNDAMEAGIDDEERAPIR